MVTSDVMFLLSRRPSILRNVSEGWGGGSVENTTQIHGSEVSMTLRGPQPGETTAAVTVMCERANGFMGRNAVT